MLRPLLLALLLVNPGPAPPAALLDTEATPCPRITVADGGLYYFKLVPDVNGSVGTVYKVAAGIDEPQWQVTGWYAWDTFLSEQGHYLVRLGDWPRGSGPSDGDLAVAFYHRGILCKQYSTRDLVEDDSSVLRSISHYSWWKRSEPCGFIKSPENDPSWFTLTTIDGIRYVFDRRTGEIVLKEQR